jgi:hypothetical protein
MKFHIFSSTGGRVVKFGSGREGGSRSRCTDVVERTRKRIESARGEEAARRLPWIEASGLTEVSRRRRRRFSVYPSPNVQLSAALCANGMRAGKSLRRVKNDHRRLRALVTFCIHRIVHRASRRGQFARTHVKSRLLFIIYCACTRESSHVATYRETS